MNTDVIVAGAGPAGLMLAGELALGGAQVIVLERLTARTGQSKALNLQPRSAEVLASRGLLDDLLAVAPALLPRGHFAGIPLDYSTLNTRYPYQIGIPQARVEERLADWAHSLGVDIRYGEPVDAYSQDKTGVTVNGHRAAYLAGCDGAHSIVRKQSGIDFAGRDGRMCALVADVTLTGDGPSTWNCPHQAATACSLFSPSTWPDSAKKLRMADSARRSSNPGPHCQWGQLRPSH